MIPTIQPHFDFCRILKECGDLGEILAVNARTLDREGRIAAAKGYVQMCANAGQDHYTVAMLELL